jgi:hypothetical protein
MGVPGRPSLEGIACWRYPYPGQIAGRQQELLREILDVADQLDPEAAERIRRRCLPGGIMPNSYKSGDQYTLFVTYRPGLCRIPDMDFRERLF